MPPRRHPPPRPEEPPADWTPTQAVPEPVINRPYEEPQRHWRYGKEGIPSIVAERRPATYWFKTGRTGTAQQELLAEEEADDLPLVNRLRQDVRRWRQSGYRGASAVTRDLLNHWGNPDRVPHRLFFCQLEAAETIIYLLELAFTGRLGATGFRSFKVPPKDFERLLKGEKPEFEELASEHFPRLIDPAADGDLLPLRRLGCKMATGSGKTVVMGMLVTWAFCNRGRNPATTTFPSGVLICAPNLTVKERLQVLRPEHPFNYYDEFDLVPAKYRALMGSGRVLVTNWHSFAPKSEHREGDTTYRVVNKGEETPEAFASDRLRHLAHRVPILVLNDEGHHCWRPKPGEAARINGRLTKEEREALKDEEEEARVWLAGLDRINNSGLAGTNTPGITACIDLSATPFYLSTSGYPEGTPFPWLVSDFGLVDAIECGIVKVPRLPVRDDTAKKDEVGRPDPKYYRLWRHIDDQLKDKDRLSNGRPKPDAVFKEAQGALTILAEQWKKRYDEIRDASPDPQPIPPVMIVVCDNTDIAEIFYERISGERIVDALDGKHKAIKKTVYGEGLIPEFTNAEGKQFTFRIDTKLLRKIETEEGETKDKAAEALRHLLSTVGQRGRPGEQVRCVVSVAMLTEGWDATNVTHVLGVRAFDSQLLCEQVVGRGLRRMSYNPDPKTGMLPAEFVDVYGIPFSLIPFKGGTTKREGSDPVYHHIYAVPERAAFEIRMPVVESYTYDLRTSGIHCDVDELEGFVVSHEPTAVYVTPIRGYQDQAKPVAELDLVKHDRSAFYERIRFQQVLFWLTQLIVDDLIQGSEGDGTEGIKAKLLARHQIFPEVLAIVQQYVDRKVRFADGVDRRELALEKYGQMLRERVRDGILPAAASDEAPLLPILNSYQPECSTADANYRTARPVASLTKSHLNLAPIYSAEGERRAIDILEESDAVECYVATDRNVGVTIAYEYQDNPHLYSPDFAVRLRGGRLVLLEIKGWGGERWDEDRVLAKNAAAKKWVAAVNNAGRWGDWAFEICRDLGKLRATLERYATASDEAKVLPFRLVRPKKGEHFRTCVPLTTLRAAAGQFSEEQAGFDDRAEWAEEWVTWEGAPAFEPGMFVAKVQGDSMEPKIPSGAYCLFRPPRGGSREGRTLLVWHSGVSDPHTGGQYTVKVYASEKVEDQEGWRHTRIVLKPLNLKYQPIVLSPVDEGEVRVIAELVGAVGSASQG